MERQNNPSIAKSLSPQKEKSRIAIKTTVPQSPINFTPNTYASAAERLVKNEKFALKFASSAFLRRLCTGWRQRPLARWFHPQLCLVHLNLSARADNTTFHLWEMYIYKTKCTFPSDKVTVSNNFTKRRQNGSKIGTRDKFATHLE